MEEVPFYKYQGAGNDFILLDDRNGRLKFEQDPELVARLCDRHFGIGSDGLIVLRHGAEAPFEMVFFNPDGYEGSFCGNGSRCFVHFAHTLKLIDRSIHFHASDGPHDGRILEDGNIAVRMKNIAKEKIETAGKAYFLDTGSPHLVHFVDDLSSIDVRKEGREIRYSDRYRQEGINVNFATRFEDGIQLITYERGVEDVTLSCGTGVTATALISAYLDGLSEGTIRVITKGGEVRVSFCTSGENFNEIWLTGPAAQVFQGRIDLENIERR